MNFDPQELQQRIENDGFAVVEKVLAPPLITELIDSVSNWGDPLSALQIKGGVFALRNLLDLPEVSELARSVEIRELVDSVLGRRSLPVRGILFDKTSGANWKVPWHQDVTIAVRERVETTGFGPWTTKAGVLHVQPPPEILSQMVSVRLHLDPCSPSNGALRVIPGSHRIGRIPEREITGVLAGKKEWACSVQSGGVLIMRPLLLHASSASIQPEHRRVIHLDFSAAKLPNGLRWYSESAASN